MNFKKNKPFVLKNKELDEKTYRYQKRLTILMTVFSLFIPIIINGFISYTYSYYIENNADYYFLDIFLYYFMGLTSTASHYICYALLIISLYLFGTRFTVKPLLTYCGGVFFTCIIVTYTVSCLLGGYVLFDFSDFESAEAFFYALFTAMLLCIKTAVIVLICKKRKQSLAKQCTFFFSVSFAIDIVLNVINTVFDIMGGGTPETAAHYIYLAQPYLESIFENIFGLFIMIYTVKLLHKKHDQIQEKTV